MRTQEELERRAGEHVDDALRTLARAGQLRGVSRSTLRAALVATWLDGAGSAAPPDDEQSDELKAALKSVAHLGAGGAGPWEDRAHVLKRRMPSYPVVGAWVNATYSVQLLQHPTHPGIDHLLLRRHDSAAAGFPWEDLQRIKDRLAPGGQGRWAFELFPPRSALVDNENLRHVWVMPVGWTPPIELNDDVRC